MQSGSFSLILSNFCDVSVESITVILDAINKVSINACVWEKQHKKRLSGCVLPFLSCITKILSAWGDGVHFIKWLLQSHAKLKQSA